MLAVVPALDAAVVVAAFGTCVQQALKHCGWHAAKSVGVPLGKFDLHLLGAWVIANGIDGG